LVQVAVVLVDHRDIGPRCRQQAAQPVGGDRAAGTATEDEHTLSVCHVDTTVA